MYVCMNILFTSFLISLLKLVRSHYFHYHSQATFIYHCTECAVSFYCTFFDDHQYILHREGWH